MSTYKAKLDVWDLWTDLPDVATKRRCLPFPPYRVNHNMGVNVMENWQPPVSLYYIPPTFLHSYWLVTGNPVSKCNMLKLCESDICNVVWQHSDFETKRYGLRVILSWSFASPLKIAGILTSLMCNVSMLWCSALLPESMMIGSGNPRLAAVQRCPSVLPCLALIWE